MITKFKIYEGIKWYSKGKLLPSEEPEEPLEMFETPIFEIGDRVYGEIGIFWYDKTTTSRNTSIKNEGYWYKNKPGTQPGASGIVEAIDYCDDLDGYTGQVIQLEAPYWPWFQTTGLKKV